MNALRELARVPVVGRLWDLHLIVPTVVITCRCGERTPITFVGTGAQAVCVGCARGYRLQSVTTNADTGEHRAQIQISALVAHG